MSDVCPTCGSAIGPPSRWRALLDDALQGMEDMIAYVPEYFREKWDHQSYIDRARKALDDNA
jgi:hypothetical protein